jgi:hypothetical protein
MPIDPTPRPVVIGWKEYLDLPEWGLSRVKVKIDTGARTTALGVSVMRMIEEAPGRTLAELELRLYRKHPDAVTTVRVPVLEQVEVRNTSGHFELRPLIGMLIRLGPVTKRVRVTVADRSHMLFPIILGRTALAGDFLIDVGRKYLLRGVK